ncbi:MAG: hypothetical protein IT379_39740 [Deltaproteobacteria bacterium]|nr:hypothetical protein [Deltaproteobacteria bacterium]
MGKARNDRRRARKTRASAKADLDAARRMLDECIRLHDAVNAVHWLHGIPWRDAPEQAKMTDQLERWRQQFEDVEQAAKLRESDDPARGVVIRVSQTLVPTLRAIMPTLKQNRQLSRNLPPKILCSDDELVQIALRVKQDGRVLFSKAEFDQRFDLASVDPFWRFVPDYTRIMVGGGFSFMSPEYDTFQMMCDAHDLAVRTGRELKELRRHALDPNQAIGG